MLAEVLHLAILYCGVHCVSLYVVGPFISADAPASVVVSYSRGSSVSCMAMPLWYCVVTNYGVHLLCHFFCRVGSLVYVLVRFAPGDVKWSAFLTGRVTCLLCDAVVRMSSHHLVCHSNPLEPCFLCILCLRDFYLTLLYIIV